MTPIQDLNSLELTHHQINFPNIPEHHRKFFMTKYSDKNEKGLKKMMQDFLKFTNNFGEPINNRGFRIDNTKVVENCIGQLKRIGSVEWRKSSQRKGTADFHATIKHPDYSFPVPVKIEIKLPGDRQSKDQKLYQSDVERSGGLYWIVQSFQDFYYKYHDFIKS